MGARSLRVALVAVSAVNANRVGFWARRMHTHATPLDPMKFVRSALVLTTAAVLAGTHGRAATVIDPNDPRNWQGATVGTFAQLYYGSDTLANRQLVVTNQLLDDGLFTFGAATAATLLPTSTFLSGNTGGRSLDTNGTLGYAYDFPGISGFQGGNLIDNLWVQTSGIIGATVWDMHGQATKAAIFNTVDHGPMPQEAIESTVYLSNGGVGPSTSWTWTQAVVEKVWLEGFHSHLGVQWDGFVYAVGTGTNSTFRYASITHGGPGSLIQDGDNEINGVLGLNTDLTPVATPDGGSTVLFAGAAIAALAAFGARRRRT